MAAIEVKISSIINLKEIKGIIEFSKEYKPNYSIVVSLESNKRIIKNGEQEIIIYPVEEFLLDLWKGLLF
jgi:hypothetical protein